jgi:hypothetical protein
MLCCMLKLVQKHLKYIAGRLGLKQAFDTTHIQLDCLHNAFG